MKCYIWNIISSSIVKKKIPFFLYNSLSVMVFSTIKLYDVPAGHQVHRDSLEKEVSTRCCKPSHAITTTLSWLSVPFYLANSLPHYSGQEDGTTTAACSAALSIYCVFQSLHGFLPLCSLKCTLPSSTKHGGLILWRQRRHKTKMERVV